MKKEPDLLKRLNSRLHGLAVDRARGTSVLLNDRFALQRLYYHEANDAFYFAAEAKAILKVRPELRFADARGLGEFIVCRCVLENRTLFRGIYVLPPGTLAFSGRSVREETGLLRTAGMGRTRTA